MERYEIIALALAAGVAFVFLMRYNKRRQSAILRRIAKEKLYETNNAEIWVERNGFKLSYTPHVAGGRGGEGYSHVFLLEAPFAIQNTDIANRRLFKFDDKVTINCDEPLKGKVAALISSDADARYFVPTDCGIIISNESNNRLKMKVTSKDFFNTDKERGFPLVIGQINYLNGMNEERYAQKLMDFIDRGFGLLEKIAKITGRNECLRL